MSETGTAAELEIAELEKVTGGKKQIYVKGQLFEIKPFTIGQLGPVMKHIGSLVKFADKDGDINLLEAFEHGSESILTVAAMAIKKDRAFFDEVELDEGLALVLAIYEVNQDFFVRKVEPLVQVALSPLNMQKT